MTEQYRRFMPLGIETIPGDEMAKLYAAQKAMEAYQVQWIQCPFCYTGWGGEDEERLHPDDCPWKAWSELND